MSGRVAEFRPCVVIPMYEHAEAVEAVVDGGYSTKSRAAYVPLKQGALVALHP